MYAGESERIKKAPVSTIVSGGFCVSGDCKPFRSSAKQELSWMHPMCMAYQQMLEFVVVQSVQLVALQIGLSELLIRKKSTVFALANAEWG